MKIPSHARQTLHDIGLSLYLVNYKVRFRRSEYLTRQATFSILKLAITFVHNMQKCDTFRVYRWRGQ